MEPGLQPALGSDDPASRSVEDGSQEAAAVAMSAGAAVRSWARAEVGGDDWIAVRGHRIGRGGVKPAFSSRISVHPCP